MLQFKVSCGPGQIFFTFHDLRVLSVISSLKNLSTHLNICHEKFPCKIKPILSIWTELIFV
ncbi:MAG: hypothetical protein CVV44_12165 [Spirochaetae bacterium HGW-Spirochaetae-1]|nr:MAG: hypothetical protein CVV44_12165 [Spirochaetae bacterium HGW-Spirochaetae-1]